MIMPSILLDRLNTIYDETVAAAVMANQRNWTNLRSFGSTIAKVRRIVVHETAGWPRRSRANVFRDRYMWTGNNPNTCPVANCGIGTQFFISSDGTVVRLIDLPLQTAHAIHVNDAALGVETANLLDDLAPPGAGWIRASTDANDIPGAKLWITPQTHNEVCPTWWTTAAHAGPAREPVGAGYMLFSEAQYRAWAILVRYLCEEFRLPRNFPLLPHTLRKDLNRDSALFRRLVLADERAEVMMRVLAGTSFNIAESSFDAANAATLQTGYRALRENSTANQREYNKAWEKFIEDDMYRGIQGHCYSGSIRSRNSKGDPIDDKTECPGPAFDFHRLARESWDWWWYPIDVNIPTGRTDMARRGYRNWNKDTPLLEYYFDENEDARFLRETEGIHGHFSSPATFSLDPHSPVYALANGELVAARFPPPGDGVSLAFVLIRHEVFHLPLRANEIAWSLGYPETPVPGAVDFDRAPSYVYSLYMHLAHPSQQALDQVHEDHPDWLNRVLIRKKECDLGVAFYDDDPKHHGISEEKWNNRPPPDVPRRPTTLDGWRADVEALGIFLDNLRAGDTAVAPRNPFVQPIRVILGDFLGEGGVIRRVGGVATHGIRVETFSPSFSPPGFERADTENWSPPTGLSPPFSLRFRSEWRRILTVEDAAQLQDIGVNIDHYFWWLTVANATRDEAGLPNAARLPRDGTLFHFHPLKFMRWLNEITWKHEWHKHEVTDASNNPVPFLDAGGNPRRPRSRRV
jgi:hypothetical protein